MKGVLIIDKCTSALIVTRKTEDFAKGEILAVGSKEDLISLQKAHSVEHFTTIGIISPRLKI
jgi:hypothetical protein